MRARDIVGKRVKAVRQVRESLEKGRSVISNLKAIEFDDGTLLRFVVREGYSQYGLEGIVVKPAKGDGR